MMAQAPYVVARVICLEGTKATKYVSGFSRCSPCWSDEENNHITFDLTLTQLREPTSLVLEVWNSNYIVDEKLGETEVPLPVDGEFPDGKIEQW
jgi:hypothetical protein